MGAVMAFIRRRLSSLNFRGKGERYSHQLVETYRDGGKVKQRVLLNLGSSASVAEARKAAQDSLEYWTDCGPGLDTSGYVLRYAKWRAECEKAYLEKLKRVVSESGKLRRL